MFLWTYVNNYTHMGLEDVADELKEIEDVEKVRREMMKGQEKQ